MNYLNKQPRFHLTWWSLYLYQVCS